MEPMRYKVFPLVIQSEWLFISHMFNDGGRTKYIDNAEVAVSYEFCNST